MDFEFNTKPELFDRRWVRTTLYVVVPALVFILVSAGIRVSQYGIDHTVLLFGDRTLRADAPAAFRISLMADDGRFFIPERLIIQLECGEKQTVLFDDRVVDGGVVPSIAFDVPPLPAARCTLALDVRFDGRRRRIRMPVTIAADSVDESLIVPKDTREQLPLEPLAIGDTRLELFTEGRGVPTGIESTLFVRATAPDGMPAESPITLIKEAEGGETVSGAADRLGLFAFTASPVGLDTRIRVHGARKPIPPGGKAPESLAPSTAADEDAGVPSLQPVVWTPSIVYSGISASVAEPVTSLGTPVRVIVEQVSEGGPVYADLYQNGSLVYATSGILRGARAALTVKPKRPGLYRLQLYTAPMGAGNATAVRHFYVLNAEETPATALRTLLAAAAEIHPSDPWFAAVRALPLERGGFDVQKAAAFVLSRLYDGHRHPEALVSSRQEDDAELAAFKGNFQRMIMIAVFALGLGVACFIGLCALFAHRKQQTLTRMILAEDIDEDAPPVTAPSASGRSGRLLLQGAVLLLILVGAFAALAVLIDTLTWMQN